MVFFSRKNKPQEGPAYPSFSARVMASLIDSIVITLCLMPIFAAIWHYGFDGKAVEQGFAKFQAEQASALASLESITDPAEKERITRQLGQEFSAMAAETGLIQKLLGHIGIQVALALAFIGAFWGWRAATPGKMLLGMKVVSHPSGNPPSAWQWAVRLLGYVISALPLGLGFIWAAFNQKRRGWHDCLSGTVVVGTERAQKVEAWSLYVAGGALILAGLYFQPLMTLGLGAACFGALYLARRFGKRPGAENTKEPEKE